MDWRQSPSGLQQELLRFQTCKYAKRKRFLEVPVHETTLIGSLILILFCVWRTNRAGGVVESLNGINFLATPPISVLVDQKIIEHTTRTSDGEKFQQAYAEQDYFGVCCSVSDESLVLYGTEIKVLLDTPTSRK